MRTSKADDDHVRSASRRRVVVVTVISVGDGMTMMRCDEGGARCEGAGDAGDAMVTMRCDDDCC